MSRIFGIVLTLLFAGALQAQTPSDDTSRGSAPPGTRDGAGPADGAITGGSILPGESAGTPQVRGTSERAKERCEELTGTLREQCLLRERNAGSGASAQPDIDSARRSDPRIEPPPQNPR